MRAACYRCKQQKVRCEKPHDGPCARCLRAGELCVKAPPSRQGKRTRSPPRNVDVLLESGELATSVVVATTSDMKLISGIMTEWGDKHEAATDILRGMFATLKMPQRSVFSWLLRHFAAVATARSSQSLFERTLKLAAACNISFADVILGLEKECVLPSLARPLASP